MPLASAYFWPRKQTSIAAFMAMSCSDSPFPFTGIALLVNTRLVQVAVAWARRIPSAWNISRPDLSRGLMGSRPGQAADERSGLRHGAVEHDVVGESVLLTARAHLVDDVIRRADEDRRHL